jgi:hypothetical protein
MIGTPMVGAMSWWLGRWGPAAGHEVWTRLGPASRIYLDPHHETLGILGARRYPYAFLAELFRTMAAVSRAPSEDRFLRDLASAGIDAAMSTTMRVLLRIGATPERLAARGQEAWDLFHDSGKVSVTVRDRTYVSTITDWANHEVIVCKVALEVRRRILERTGLSDVSAHRERCVAWGHDCCEVRLTW